MKISQANIPFDTLDPTEFEGDALGVIISKAILWVFPIAGFLVLIFIVFGGFQVMLSQGDPKALAAGKAKITYAIIGLVVLFAAYWIMQVLGMITGFWQILDLFTVF